MTLSLEVETVGHFNRRWGVRLEDGARVESVLYRGDTLCLSTQVGCAVRCPFCASGAHGLGRGLSVSELVGQVEAVRQRGHRVRRLTLSGVGEPLHNERNVSPFFDWARRERLPVSVTTSGGPLEGLRRWLHRPHNGLTLSVHAGREETRAKAVPHGPSLHELGACLREELSVISRRRFKKTALALLVIAGLNDEDEEIDAFAEWAREFGLRVHLYDHNPVATSSLRGVGRARYEAIYTRLRATGLSVQMSSQARLEPTGGCGTLVALRSPRRA